jgi:hypothetical protein
MSKAIRKSSTRRLLTGSIHHLLCPLDRFAGLLSLFDRQKSLTDSYLSPICDGLIEWNLWGEFLVWERFSLKVNNSRATKSPFLGTKEEAWNFVQVIALVSNPEEYGCTHH